MEKQRQEQIAQAEEILGDNLGKSSFAKGYFFGEFHRESLPPYPDIHSIPGLDDRLKALKEFVSESIDPVKIDREKEIPHEIITGLGELGILGACLPEWCGGSELSQVAYCQLLEVLGARCASTSLFVNAHHSIGPRALVLFGNEVQQQKWLPKLATGEWLSAFALTEPEAGSDAANVQTTATLSDDGTHYVLNGEKRWITNGAIAKVLTVMAKTRLPDNSGTAITAFLVTPDMPGFEVVEARMEKCGVRGSVTSRLRFREMKVPAENVLGKPGKGLKVALTVLDFGRTTFGATCTGIAKECVAITARHANQRVQFQQQLGSFELVKEKIALMESMAYAMEACTYQTAALIDADQGDFMLETAMLKVFATETLWPIVYDTFQIHGGMAYFCDEPYERMMRDARLNSIGEGANDVLRTFMVLVGMREVGLNLEAVLHAFFKPITGAGVLCRFIAKKTGSMLLTPQIPVRSSELENDVATLAKTLSKFGKRVEWLLRVHQMEIMDRQYQLGRVADVVMDIYASTCVLRRLDQLLVDPKVEESEKQRQLKTGRYFLAFAQNRTRLAFAAMRNNQDPDTTSLADDVLAQFPSAADADE